MQYSFVNPGRFSQVLEFILQHIFANHQKLSGLFQSYTILKDIGMNAGYEGPRKHGDLFSPDDHLLAPRVDLASRLAEYRIILEDDTRAASNRTLFRELLQEACGETLQVVPVMGYEELWNDREGTVQGFGAPASLSYGNPHGSSLLPLSRAHVGGRKVLVKRCRGEDRFSVVLGKDVGEHEDLLMRITDLKPYLERLGVYEEWMWRFVQQ